jgi:hypothetical protein
MRLAKRILNECKFIIGPALIVLIDLLLQCVKYGHIIQYDTIKIFLFLLSITLIWYAYIILSGTNVQVRINMQPIECPICYESFHVYYKLKCQHCYCENCLDQWMDVNDKCPYCRNDIG